MKLTVGKKVAKEILSVKLTVPDEHPIMTNDCVDYYVWANRIEECNSLEEICDLIKPKYKLRFMQLLMQSQYILHKDVGNLVAHCWKYISSFRFNLYFSKEMFLRLIVNADKNKFMTEDEFLIYQNLPEELVIYRGGTISTKKGVCWTLDENIAREYAKKYNGSVFRATIKKKYTFAYMHNHKTILAHYRRLENLKEM